LEPFETIDSSSIRFMASVGAGLDIGITKAITLTLFAKYRLHTPSSWLGLDRLIEVSPDPMEYDDTDSAITQFEPGSICQF